MPEQEPQQPIEIFTEDECLVLILALLAGHGEDGASEDEMLRWLEYCERARIANSTVDLALHGLIKVKWDETQNDFVFKTFNLAPELEAQLGA